MPVFGIPLPRNDLNEKHLEKLYTQRRDIRLNFFFSFLFFNPKRDCL